MFNSKGISAFKPRLSILTQNYYYSVGFAFFFDNNPTLYLELAKSCSKPIERKYRQ